MKIRTKYNIKDKVWYYIEQFNKYAWGKIESIEVKVGGYNERIRYFMKNRFCGERKKSYYFSPTDFYCSRIVEREEEELFKNPEEVKKYLNRQHKEKMDDLCELKKGLFG